VSDWRIRKLLGEYGSIKSALFKMDHSIMVKYSEKKNQRWPDCEVCLIIIRTIMYSSYCDRTNPDRRVSGDIRTLDISYQCVLSHVSSVN